MRNLLKYKVQNIISITGLSVSVACFTVCFYIVRALTGIDKDIPNVDRMYMVMDSTEINRPAFDPQTGNFLKRDFPEVEKSTTVEFPGKRLFEIDEKSEQCMLNMIEVTPSFFDFFSVNFITPPQASYETQINEIVLCESAAIRLFATLDVIGKTLSIEVDYFEGNYPNYRMAKKMVGYTVCGVIKDFRKNSFINMMSSGNFLVAGNIDAMFLNDEFGRLRPNSDRGITAAKNIIMLHKGASVKEFNQKIGKDYSKKIARNLRWVRDNSRYYVIPFSSTLKQIWGDRFWIITGMLSGIGLLILLVSVFNYASYTVNTVLNKRHECAIRKTANAGYIHIFFLFFTETAITIILSGILALCWIQVFFPFVNDLFSTLFSIDMETICIQITQYVTMGIVLATLLYIIPVSRINNKAVTDLFHGGRRKNPKSNVRNILLGFQLFICIIFISGTVFMHLQLQYISSETINTLTKTEKENIFNIPLNHSSLYDNKANIIQKLKANPAIELFLLGHPVIERGSSFTDFQYENKPLEGIKDLLITPDYARLVKAKILEGRFAREDNETVINTLTKNMLGKENVIGEIFTSHGTPYTIVGVMDDILTASASTQLVPAVFMFSKSSYYVYAKVVPAQKKKAKEYIIQTIREHLPPAIEYNLPTLSDEIAEVAQLENTLFKLISMFAGISIIISLSGVYSSVLLATERRRKEVAIRKINGAGLGDIIGLFLRKYLYILVIAAIPSFTVIYIAVTRWLEMYVYRISVSWTVFAFIFVALNCLLILTVIYQLVKTARLNPAQVVKSDN
jgi:ABC-type antimicrobial peptide transport system permease subunit